MPTPLSPLPPPTSERAPVHERAITIRGYRRNDGLWDIEGHLRDVRDQHFVYPGGECPAGEPIHSMWLRLTVDATASIVDAVAATDASPFPGVCGQIAPDYAQLIGLRVGPGFSRQTARLFNGIHGCTHMSELLRTMGTSVLQTVAGDTLEVPEAEKPFQLDGCHALATDGPRVAAFYPRWYRAKPKPGPTETRDS
jgi:hypothetical protein